MKRKYRTSWGYIRIGPPMEDRNRGTTNGTIWRDKASESYGIGINTYEINLFKRAKRLTENHCILRILRSFEHICVCSLEIRIVSIFSLLLIICTLTVNRQVPLRTCKSMVWANMRFPENLSFKDSTKPGTLISFSKQLVLFAPSRTLPAGDECM